MEVNIKTHHVTYDVLHDFNSKGHNITIIFHNTISAHYTFA